MPGWQGRKEDRPGTPGHPVFNAGSENVLLPGDTDQRIFFNGIGFFSMLCLIFVVII